MRKTRLLFATTALATILCIADVRAQSSPGWSFGYTPTAAQWNQAFANKQDFVVGFTPLNANGGTMTGELVTAASTTSSAGFNITPGTAPNSPNNGDMWSTAAGLFVQINGSTAQLSAGTGGASSLLSTNNTWTGTNLFNGTLTAGTGFYAASFFYDNYNAPTTTPSTGTGVALSANYSNGGLETDVWNTGTGASPSFIFKQMNGAGTFKNLVDIALGSGSSGGIVNIYGLTSGKISLTTGSAAAGTYNWIYPVTAGNAGQILTSQGGTGAMTWSTAGAGSVTSVGINGGPSSPVNATGTCTITVSGNCQINAYFGPPQGRLTLQNGTAVMTSSSTNVQTIFYTPFVGNYVPIYNGTTLSAYGFSTGSVGLSLALTSGTAVWPANTVFDVMVTLNGTAVVMCTGSAWSSTSSRAANLSIGLSPQGIMSNTGTGPFGCHTGSATTVTISQYQGTYVGTFITDPNTAAQTSFTYGGAASSGSGAFFEIWNYYNRVTVTTRVVDNGASYTYTSATARAARASNNNRVTFVSGIPEDGYSVAYTITNLTVAAIGAFTEVGIGLNSTNSYIAQPQFNYDSSTQIFESSLNAPYQGAPVTGLTFLQAIENGDGTNANTFNNSSLANLMFNFRM